MKSKQNFYPLFALLTLLLAALACDDSEFVVEEAPPTPFSNDSNQDEGEAPPADTSWYQIYFTDPTCPPEEERQGGLDEIIAQDILQAQFQVDVAAFDFDAPPIIDALIELEGKGITVRVVTDTDNEDLSSIRRLRRNGISVITDDRSALMHNKFIVVDKQYVWMGSMNFTTNDVYCYNNNTVWLDSAELAANYSAEMDEMYDERQFGPRSPSNTPLSKLTINGVAVENYFASEEEVAPILANLVAEAQQEILFMAFSFTNEEIGEAMLARAEDGVDVRGVFEKTGSETAFSYYTIMTEAAIGNVQVRQDGNNRLMHHKVIIIDRQIVIFGSFNFSASANDSNDENVVIVYDPTFTSYFVEEFNVVWSEAEQ